MISKSDEHYRQLESKGYVEPIVLMEQLMERLIENGVPVKAALNIVLAQKHQLRAGEKTGEGFKKEIHKSINYLTRATTGSWIKKEEVQDGNKS